MDKNAQPPLHIQALSENQKLQNLMERGYTESQAVEFLSLVEKGVMNDRLKELITIGTRRKIENHLLAHEYNGILRR